MVYSSCGSLPRQVSAAFHLRNALANCSSCKLGFAESLPFGLVQLIWSAPDSLVPAMLPQRILCGLDVLGLRLKHFHQGRCDLKAPLEFSMLEVVQVSPWQSIRLVGSVHVHGWGHGCQGFPENCQRLSMELLVLVEACQNDPQWGFQFSLLLRTAWVDPNMLVRDGGVVISLDWSAARSSKLFRKCTSHVGTLEVPHAHGAPETIALGTVTGSTAKMLNHLWVSWALWSERCPLDSRKS